MRVSAVQNKHQQRSEATRRRLLNSARRIFARDGFEAARIEEIAGDAGYTRGAFYANFESKEDLFFALLEKEGSTRLANIHQLLECCSNPEERLQALREYYVKQVADRQLVMLILEFKLFALRHGHLRARLAGAHRRIRSSLKIDAIQNLLPTRIQVSPESDEARRVVLEATLNGLVLERAYDPKRISDDQMVSSLRRIFDSLLQTQSTCR